MHCMYVIIFINDMTDLLVYTIFIDSMQKDSTVKSGTCLLLMVLALLRQEEVTVEWSLALLG